MTLPERRAAWAESGAVITDGENGFHCTDLFGKRWFVTEDGAERVWDNPAAADLYRDYLTQINLAVTAEDVRHAHKLRDRADEIERGAMQEAAE